MDSRTAVLSYVRENPGCQFKDLVDGIDFSRGAISKRLNRMLIDGELDYKGSGHKKYYAQQEDDIIVDLHL